MKSSKQIVAIVGTVDPEDRDIPFIPLEELISGRAINYIRRILDLEDTTYKPNNNYISIQPYVDIFSENLIVVVDNFKGKDDVLYRLGDLLIKNKYVDERFLLDVYRREIMCPTLFANKIALPHGAPENVIKPAIALAILEHPIEWFPEKMVELVFMIALKKDSAEIAKCLYKILKDSNFIDKIKGSRDPKMVKEIFLEHILNIG